MAWLPGSPWGNKDGCLCPKEDNNGGIGQNGRGGGGRLFLIDYSCPLHGGELWRDNEQEPRPKDAEKVEGNVVEFPR